MKRNSKLTFTILSVVLIIPALFGLMHSGFFLTDDGNWMIIRFSAFYEALRGGQFPVRFLFRLNNGYGYPVADFLYPLFMYIGVPIHLLGFSFVNTIKIIMGLSLVLSSLFCFLWLKKHFENYSSLIGAAAYALFPYHLYDVYVRGSVGEILALAIVPFIFWQIDRRSFPLVSVGLALLILAHNSIALMFFPVVILYIFLKKGFLKKGIASVLVSLGISAFFWIPALYDKQFTVFDRIQVSDPSKYFITFQNLNLFGIFFFIGLIGSFYFLKKKDRLFSYFFIIIILFSLLAIPISKDVWKLLPLPNFIQFPFRFLSVVSLGFSFLIAFQFNNLKINKKPILMIISLFLIFISSKNYIYPKSFNNYPDSFYSTNVDSTTVKNEYMPKWAGSVSDSPPMEKVTVIKGHQKIDNLFINGNNISFSFYSPQETLIQINKIYFPGWVVKVDRKETPLLYNKDNGLIRFISPAGSHMVSAGFYETKVRYVSDLISLLSIFLIIFTLFKEKAKFLEK